MGYYGGPELSFEWVYVATQPLSAEHPIGSGITVKYEPGERIPADEWGNAAHNLVEMGKAVRYAVDTPPVGGTVVSPPVVPDPEPDPVAEALALHEGRFPIKGPVGWYTLSSGERIRGEDAAHAAQRLLDEEGSS